MPARRDLQESIGRTADQALQARAEGVLRRGRHGGKQGGKKGKAAQGGPLGKARQPALVALADQ
jgi:hypothetical protein